MIYSNLTIEDVENALTKWKEAKEQEFVFYCNQKMHDEIEEAMRRGFLKNHNKVYENFKIYKSNLYTL